MIPKEKSKKKNLFCNYLIVASSRLVYMYLMFLNIYRVVEKKSKKIAFFVLSSCIPKFVACKYIRRGVSNLDVLLTKDL